jgi:hypothetical protein
MEKKGAFGYKIGKKIRLMNVSKDAELLWQILVREIYVIMKHFGSKEEMKKSFEKIKLIKTNPKNADIEKYKKFTNLEEKDRDIKKEWTNILYYCQSSFINLLESECILNVNNEECKGVIFLLDLNKGEALNYIKSSEGKIIHLKKATIEEIMEFEDMPEKTYTEIITETNERFDNYYTSYQKIEEELSKLKNLKETARNQGAVNIENKIEKLISDMEWEEKKLHKGRRDFYYRLKMLDLIDEK